MMASSSIGRLLATLFEVRDLLATYAPVWSKTRRLRSVVTSEVPLAVLTSSVKLPVVDAK